MLRPQVTVKICKFSRAPFTGYINQQTGKVCAHFVGFQLNYSFVQHHESQSATSPVPEFGVGVQLLACITSERISKHMRASLTLTQIDAQARPLNVAAMIRESWIDGIETAKIN